jgi:hypothetical protein
MLKEVRARSAQEYAVNKDNTAGVLPSESDKFEGLQLELRLLDVLRSDIKKVGYWSDDLEAHWESRRERLLDAMHDVACLAVEVPSECLEQLRVKARILLDYCTPEGGDMADQLSVSICRDILAMSHLYGLSIASTRAQSHHSRPN